MTGTGSTSSRPAISCSTSTTRPRPPASFPTIARSSSSGSATRSATGAVCVLSPFGAQVHAPWAMALQARLSDRWGIDVELLWSDDGIVLRLPEAIDEVPVDDLLDRPRRHRRARDLATTELGAVRISFPGVRGACVVVAAATTRSTHAVVAATPEGRRPVDGRGAPPDVPDPARDHSRVRERRVRPAGACARC